MLIKVAIDCLDSNTKSEGLEEIFQRLNQRRAELSLVLLQRLIESGSGREDIPKLLETTWAAIQNSDTSFEKALLTGDAGYYRILLKILFLALRIEAKTATPDPNVSTRMHETSHVTRIVLEILETVVAIGIKDLATFIHEKPTEANPDDIALVTGKHSNFSYSMWSYWILEN